MNDDVGLVSLNIVETQTDNKKSPSNVSKFHMYELLGSLYGLGVCVSIYPCYLSIVYRKQLAVSKVR